ncbi:MAG: hypothetical protein HYW50_01620 [Candidatus Diapherotrites archaeon]|nr:hypothetical protein [Candidatus Diapherotrites archaeon]
MAEKKLKIGWFSFSCCEDSSIVFSELLNDHYKEWLKLIDFKNVRLLYGKIQKNSSPLALAPSPETLQGKGTVFCRGSKKKSSQW